jgi:hypothetical protein
MLMLLRTSSIAGSVDISLRLLLEAGFANNQPWSTSLCSLTAFHLTPHTVASKLEMGMRGTNDHIRRRSLAPPGPHPIRITEPQEHFRMHRVLRSTKELQCRTKIASNSNCDVSIPKGVNKVRRSVDPQPYSSSSGTRLDNRHYKNHRRFQSSLDRG